MGVLILPSLLQTYITRVGRLNDDLWQEEDSGSDNWTVLRKFSLTPSHTVLGTCNDSQERMVEVESVQLVSSMEPSKVYFNELQDANTASVIISVPVPYAIDSPPMAFIPHNAQEQPWCWNRS